MFDKQYNDAPLVAQGFSPRALSTKERIEMNIQETEERLANIKRMKQLLDENPQLQELLDLFRKVSGIL